MADFGSHHGSEGIQDSSIEPLRGDNIVLIGMRGSGKSTIAELLRVATKKRIIDTDKVIEEKEKMSIKEIVDTKGEDYFRRLEDEVVDHASRQSNVIIATGGGAVTRKENRDALRRNSICIWLQANVVDLVNRTKGDENRFPLNAETTPEAQTERTLKERKHMYEETKDAAVVTTGKSPNVVTNEILELIKKRKAKA